jgi:hypothetical protein
MKTSSSLGIPINLGIATIIALIFTGSKETSIFQSDIPIFGLALGVIIQEILLVQWLSRSANTLYEERLMGLDISTTKRYSMILMPVLLFIIVGFIIAHFATRALDFNLILRIIAVSSILALCLDPLIGLFDKGPVPLIGAGITYLIVLNASLTGYNTSAELLSYYIPEVASNGIVVFVLAYLLLSCRWTYYKLFCYEEMDDWKQSVIDTALPLVFLLIGISSKIVDLLNLLFTGS